MKAKRKIPLRKSVVSGLQLPKKELIRITRNKEGIVAIDPTGKAAGRGAYIGIEPKEAEMAKKKDILSRVLEAKVSDEFYNELIEYVTHLKARQELFKDDDE
ncbi:MULTISPECIES: YlxR family RNase P modulator [unclassified Enterococcus]|uniref:RNase P modulator RnpM n=1 Tax=unclassified Enterococcus TaxID=2608891 RepID=UPI001552142E|nr:MULTISPECIES: YlxR family RNase P modulator [unclassified Enterococcus]MBS7576633.1 YlxR family protein [Enterococcus sp. MMGLQ5-2]MBS7583880.1 YlxR family protein [Enterococcus sp. MMGLQ5-1]NPD11741.1 YlxR family protein [Enterococcus sp. MMGLQ5-1]NPD36470.1 YlxR family protein [Enterococcus sp. MMGLQ5-2]